MTIIPSCMKIVLSV